VRGALALALLAVGCSPPIEEGQVLCSDGRCPESHPICGSDGRCYTSCVVGPCGADAGMDAGVGVDAGPSDAGPSDGGVDGGEDDAGADDAGLDAGPAACGETRWSLAFSGASATVELHDLAIAPDRSLVVGGEFSGPLDYDGVPTGLVAGLTDPDALVASLRPDGSLRWARQLGSTGLDRVVAVALHPEGDVYVAVTHRSDVVVPIDGAPVASVTTDCPTDAGVPDAGADAGACSRDGGPCTQIPGAPIGDATGCTGCVASSCVASFVARLDGATGDVRWATPVGDAWLRAVANPLDAPARALDVDDDGRLYVTGTLSCTASIAGDRIFANGRRAPVLARFSPEGRGEWATDRFQYNFGNNLTNRSADIAVGPLGVFHAGRRDDRAYVGRSTACGEQVAGMPQLLSIASPDDGAFDDLESIALASDGTVIGGGHFEVSIDLGDGPVTAMGAGGAFLVRMNTLLDTILDAQILDGAGDEHVRAVAITEDACASSPEPLVVVLGTYTATFDPTLGAGTPLDVDGSGNDAFLAIYRWPLGGPLTHVASTRLGGRSADSAGGLAASAEGDVFIGLSASNASPVALPDSEASSSGARDGFAVRTHVATRDGG